MYNYHSKSSYIIPDKQRIIASNPIVIEKPQPIRTSNITVSKSSMSLIQLRQPLFVRTNILTAAVALWVRAFAPQAGPSRYRPGSDSIKAKRSAISVSVTGHQR